MRQVIHILNGLLILAGLWIAFFVVVMGCFAALMWVYTRFGGGRPERPRRRRES
jgi:hypothetical protein